MIRRHQNKFASSHGLPVNHPIEAEEHTPATEFVWLVEADEGGHLAMEQDADVTILSSPLSLKPIDDAHVQKLSKFGLKKGHHTMDLSNILSKISPGMRHSRF